MFWGKCIPARGKIKGRGTEAGTNMVDHRQTARRSAKRPDCQDIRSRR